MIVAEVKERTPYTLVSALSKFWENEIARMVDIESVFYQATTSGEQRWFVTILWLENGKFKHKNSYLVDLLKSARSAKETIDPDKDIKRMWTSSGWVYFHKFMSNSKSIIRFWKQYQSIQNKKYCELRVQ